MTFKTKYSFQKRQEEARDISLKYPSRLPVIIEKSKDSSLEQIDKFKYLVPRDLTLGQLIFVLRKRLTISASEAIYIFHDKSIPALSTLMGELTQDDDGFIYLTYTGEVTFG